MELTALVSSDEIDFVDLLLLWGRNPVAWFVDGLWVLLLVCSLFVFGLSVIHHWQHQAVLLRIFPRLQLHFPDFIFTRFDFCEILMARISFVHPRHACFFFLGYQPHCFFAAKWRSQSKEQEKARAFIVRGRSCKLVQTDWFFDGKLPPKAEKLCTVRERPKNPSTNVLVVATFTKNDGCQKRAMKHELYY